MLSIRDINQLQESPKFGPTAIEGLLCVEESLCQALRFVPYSEEHYEVWSPHFTGIILDAASLMDSIWKAAATVADPSSQSDKLTIRDHYEKSAGLVSNQAVVFFGGASPRPLFPFVAWQRGDFCTPTWWDAYNKLKHDRFANQTAATLEHAVNAVAALLLALVYSGSCDVSLISAKLLAPSSYNIWAYTTSGLLRDASFECRATIETKLFAHPLGVFAVDNCNLSRYWPEGSPRFAMWWALNADAYTKPLTLQ